MVRQTQHQMVFLLRHPNWMADVKANSPPSMPSVWLFRCSSFTRCHTFCFSCNTHSHSDEDFTLVSSTHAELRGTAVSLTGRGISVQTWRDTRSTKTGAIALPLLWIWRPCYRVKTKTKDKTFRWRSQRRTILRTNLFLVTEQTRYLRRRTRRSELCGGVPNMANGQPA